MTGMQHSPQSDELLAPLEVRRKALEILRSRGRRALDDVEKMLGWEHPIGINGMAQQLGITIGQLRYMLFRKEWQKEAKERRIAKKEAGEIEFIAYTSSKLKFTISFPAHWRVDSDILETESDSATFEQAYAAFQKTFPDSGMSLEDYRRELHKCEAQREVSAKKAYQRLLKEERAKVVKFVEFKKVYECNRLQAYRLFFEKLLGTPVDEEMEALASRELSAKEVYNFLMEDPQTFLIEFEEFKYNYDASFHAKRASAENDMRLQRMMVGLFQIAPPDNENEDEINIEVTKLRLTNSFTALDLYNLDKQPSETVPWGNRPSKGIVVDGLQGVLYYYLFDTGDPLSEEPVFFNVYLTEKDEGWIISCSCKYGDSYFKTFIKNKPVFKRIVSSFKRI